jgi:ABC-type transport system involved in multi-copper enzyme maturation permease subunit
MLPGPVFTVELITTARRARYYFIRFVYGLVLLFFIGLTGWDSDPNRGTRTIQEISAVGEQVFFTFIWVQSFAVILLTPALVAGVIADEKRRKTLHYLLASSLTSGEIILGKLLARLLHVGVFLLIGLPIMNLVSLFGGVDPTEIWLLIGATITTAYFLAALAILVSTFARRTREAITMVYMIEMAWLFFPVVFTLILPSVSGFWSPVFQTLRPINDWIGASSPLYALYTAGTGRGPAVIGESLLWMMGLQLAFGSVLVLCSIVLLRPLFRRQGEDGRLGRWTQRIKRGRRFLPRPPCGDDAMIWKERYVSRMSAPAKIVAGIVALLALGVIGYATYEIAKDSYREWLAYGYGTQGNTTARASLNAFLRAIGTMLYIFWVLGLASASSSGIASEREEDTWTSLLTTPLSGEEIIRGKMVGAFWSMRLVGVLLLALWTLGLILGAVHPIGYVAAIFVTSLYLWFPIALGTYFSLRSKTAARAMTATVAVLVVTNGAYLMCCLAPWHRWDSAFPLIGVSPMVMCLSLLSYEDVNQFFTGTVRSKESGDFVLVCVISLFLYTVAAAVLTFRAINNFDAIVERPTRRYGAFTPPPPAGKSERPEDEELG